MFKKLILAAAFALISFSANAQFGRYDYRTDIVEYLENDFLSSQYTLFANKDIIAKDDGDIVVWKFDGSNRLYDVYMWFNNSSEDEDFRTTLNNSGKYSHPDYNTWKEYSTNGTLIAVITYGSFNTTYGDYRTTFSRSTGWHIDYRY